MLFQFLIFILGFVFLIYGGSFLVDGASSLAKHFKISDLVIGLTIVSFGTSAPELMVNIMASIQNKGDITIGNIIGSNIANILLILGVASVISPIYVQASTIWKEIPFSMLAVIVFFILSNDYLLDGKPYNFLDRSDGLILLCFFTVFLSYIVSLSKQTIEEQIIPAKYGKFTSFIFFLIGLFGLILGGRMVVDSGSNIARNLGVSEAFIGFTLIAIGTSLPELFASAIAAYKKNSDIAIGNIVGSNIFNIFWILGVSSLIRPIPYSAIYNFDIIILVLATSVLFTFMFTGKRNTLFRKEGGLLLALYIFYLIYLIFRG
ncbi:MAG: calcium/sodium antiporter [Proteobacteria bacterium]|nr:calcium/sodium antiporter [Pseudomonadota bacterium]